MAIVLAAENGRILIEQRNKFSLGDSLEILSPTDSFNKVIKIERMEDEDGNIVEEAKNVQQKLWIYTDIPVEAGDILRK